MDYKDFFGCEFPLVCMPMNGISDIAFAINVCDAGVFPSLSSQMFLRSHSPTPIRDRIIRDIDRFATKFNHCRLMFSMTNQFLIKNYSLIVKLVLKYGLSHIELVVMENEDFYYSSEQQGLKERIVELRSIGLKILYKTLSFNKNFRLSEFDDIDGFVIKGMEGAGKIHPKIKPLQELVVFGREAYPNANLIPSGGVGSSEDVRILMSLGATAIGIGTLFAVSKESKISEETKMKMLSYNKDQLDVLKADNLPQNAIVFSKFNEEDDNNNTRSLYAGIRGDGGHIFAGKGITKINELLSIREIAERLVPVVGLEPTLGRF